MAKTAILPAGTVRETVTQERFVSDADTHKTQFSGMDFWDVMETSGSAEEWRQQNYSCYVNRGINRSGYLVKFFEWRGLEYLRDKEEIIFDGKVIQKGIGGGDFHYIFKKGSERIAEGNFNIEGPEKKVGQASAGGPDRGSDLVEIVRMLREERDGAGTDSSLMKAAMINALEIQKAAIASNQMGPAQMIELMVKLRGEHSSGMPDWAKQMLAAAVPAFTTAIIGLITKSLTPQDGMTVIKQFGEIQSMIKTMGGEPSAPDIAVEILRNGPMLLGQVGNLLGKLNDAQQMKLLSERTPAAPPMPARPAAASPAPPPIPAEPRRAVPASAAAMTAQTDLRTAPNPGTPDFQAFLADRVVAMVKNGDDGEFVFNWLHVADPVTLRTLREIAATNNLTAEQLGALISSGEFHPKLAELAALPNFRQFIAEFHAVLMAPAPAA